MALHTGLPIPGHYSVNYVTATTYTVPTFLGVYRGNPPADAIWTLSPLVASVAGATLYICNNSAFNLVVNAAPGDMIGTGTSISVAAGITQLFLTAGGNVWQTIIPMTILPPPPPPVNIVQPCRVGTVADFAADPGYTGVIYVGPGTFTLTPVSLPAMIDGVAIQVGDRVLVKDEVAEVQNGIYAATSIAPKLVLVRTTDALYCNIVIGLNSGVLGQQSSYSLVTLNPVIGGSSTIVWIKNNILASLEGTMGGWNNMPALPSGGSTIYGSLCDVAGSGQIYVGQQVGNVANGDNNLLIGNDLNFEVGAINMVVGIDNNAPFIGETTIAGISNSVTSGGTGLVVYGQSNMITGVGATHVNVFGTSNNIGSICGIFGFSNTVASSDGSMLIGNVNSLAGSAGALLFGVSHNVGSSAGAVIIGNSVVATGATGSVVVSGSGMTLNGDTNATIFGNSNVAGASKNLVTIFGNSNTVNATSGLTLGTSNTVGGIGSLAVGGSNVSSSSNVLLMGESNTESGSSSVTVTGSNNSISSSGTSMVKGFSNILSSSANSVVLGSSVNLANSPLAMVVSQTALTINGATHLTLAGNGCSVGNSLANVTVFGYGNTANSSTNTIFGTNNSATGNAFIFGVGNTVGVGSVGAIITGLTNVVTTSSGVVINGVSNSLTGCNGAVVVGRTVTLTNVSRALILTNTAVAATGNTGLIMVGGGNSVPNGTTNNALIGTNNVSGGNENSMFGHNNSGTGDINVIFGNNNVSASFNVILGHANTATGTNVVVSGISNVVTGSSNSVVYGDSNTITTSPTALIIGMNITASGSSNVIALATAGTSLTGNTETVLIGNSSSIAGGASMVTVVGYGNSAANSDVAVFGTNNSATGANTNVFGVGNNISSDDVSAYGINHTVSGSVGVCVFGISNMVVNSGGAIVGGGGLSVTGCTNALVVSATPITANGNNNLVLLGDGNSITTGVGGITIVGSTNSAALGNTVIVGTGNVVGSSGAVVVGVGSTASGTGGLVFGSGITNSVANSLAIGSGGSTYVLANVAGVASSTSGQSGFYANQPANTKNPAGTTYQLTTVDVAPDSLIVAQSVTAGNETWTLPTAAALLAVFGLSAVGTSFMFSIRNQSITAWIILAANTGVTFGLQTGNLVPCASTVTMKVTLTALTPTYVVQQVNAAPSVENTGNNLLVGPSTSVTGGVTEAVVIGDSATSGANSAVVIGQGASSTGASSVVLGKNNVGSATGVVVLGNGMTNGAANSLLVGAGGVSWLMANAAGISSGGSGPSGFYANQPANTKNPAGVTYQMTVVDVAPGSLIVAQSVTAGNETWTLPTAAALLAVFTPSVVGTAFRFSIRNQSITAWIILAANTGVTFGLQSGNLVPCASTVELKVTLTALTPTYVVQTVGVWPSVENTGNNLLVGPSTSLAGGVTEAIVIGDSASALASSAIVVGQNSVANASGVLALGNNVTGGASSAVVLGNGMNNSVANSLLVGGGGVSWLVANAAGVGSSGGGQSGFYANQPANVKNPAGATYQLTVVDVAPGALVVAQSVTAGGETWTVPTAAALLAVFSPTVAGTSFVFTIINQSVVSQISLAANTGVTFGISVTNLVGCATTVAYKVTCTSSVTPTYTFQQVSTSPNTQNVGTNLVYGPNASVAAGVTEAVVIGDGANVAANSAIVVGHSASVTGVGSTSAIVVGQSAVGSAANVVVLGQGMTNSAANSLLVGAGGTSWLVANVAGVGTSQSGQAGFYYNMPANVKNPAGTTYQMTIVDVAPDALVVAQSVTAGNETWTLPTAAALLAVFSPSAVGTAFVFSIRNQSTVAWIILAANTGVTFGLQSGNIVPCATTVTMKVTMTALTPTYVVQTVGVWPSVENTGNNLLFGLSTTIGGGATESIVIGDGATASANSTVALGQGANAAAVGSLAIGEGASVSGAGSTSAVVVGQSAVGSAANVVVLGQGMTNGVANSLLVGAGGTSWLVANAAGVGTSQTGQAGFYYNMPANTKNPAGATYQMTTVDVAPDALVVAQSVTAGNETWTLPTAAAIFAVFGPSTVGTAFVFEIRNQSVNSWIILAANTGVTFGIQSGNLVPCATTVTMKVTCTALTPTYVVQQINSSPSTQNTSNNLLIGPSTSVTSGVTESVVLGDGASAAANSAVVVGQSASVSGAGSTLAVVVGKSVVGAAANTVTLGNNITNSAASSLLVGSAGSSWLVANSAGVGTSMTGQAGFYTNIPANTKNPAGTTYALTTSDVAPNSVIVAQSVTAGNETWTFPTANVLFAVFTPNAVGTAFTFEIRNQSTVAWIILAANTGITFGLQSANLVPCATTVTLKVTVTALTPTYVVQQINAAPSVENTGNNLLFGPSTVVTGGATESIVIGDTASAAANNAIVFGQGASVTGAGSTSAVVMGKNAVGSAANVVVIGQGMTNSAANSLLVGAGGTSWLVANAAGIGTNMVTQAGFYYNMPANIKNPAGTTYSMTVVDVAPNSVVIAQSVTAGNETWTLPTASAIFAVFGPSTVGTAFTFDIRNQSTVAWITLAANTGVTFGIQASNQIPCATDATLKVTCTAVTPTYVVQTVSLVANIGNVGNNLLFGMSSTIGAGVVEAIAIGDTASSTANNTISVGQNAAATAVNAIVLGNTMTNSVTNSLLVGAGGSSWLVANTAGIGTNMASQAGFYYNMPANTKNPAGTTYQMTVTDVSPNAFVVAQSVTAGNETWTLPTASSIFAIFGPNAVGTAFTFEIRNQSLTAWIILAANTGVTFGLQAGNLVPCATTVTMKVTVTALTPTYVIQQINSAPSTQNTGNNWLVGPSSTITGGATESVVLGDSASTAANNAIVFGQGASVSGAGSTNAIVMGKNGVVSAAGAVVIGNGMSNALTNTLVAGSGGTSWMAAASGGVSSSTSNQSGFYCNQPANTKNPAGASYSMTTVDVSPDSLIVAQSVTAAGETWTVPTAAALLAAFSPTVAGSSFTFTIRNQSLVANITLASNTGVTFGLEASDVVLANNVATYKVTCTSASTPTYVFQQVALIPGNASIENFNVSTSNTVVSPTATINITTLQISAATGTTTGTLANGTTNGFMKTISVDQAVTPYVLTITNYLNQYGGQSGAIGSYAITFTQPGTSYTFMWDSTAGTWVNRSFSQPPYISRYVITISLDAVTSSIVRAVGSDNVVVSTGTNVNGGGTTTATVLNAAGAYLSANYGGGDIFIKGGTYFLIGNVWIISQANINVRGEATTLLYSSVAAGFTAETSAADTGFFNLRFGFLAGFSATVVNGTITYGNQTGIITAAGAARLTIRDCRFIGLVLGISIQSNISDTLINLNLFETCYQGVLYASVAAGFSVRHTATNNNLVGLQNYGILVSNGCKSVVVANNTMDLVQSITTASNVIGYGIGVTGDGSNNAVTGVVADVSVIGNQIRNSYCAGVWIQTGVSNITITGNTIDTCAATVVTPLGGNIGNLAAINVPVTGTTNVTVCDNTITGCYNPILLYGNGCYASGNILLSNAGQNYYIRGNAITNIDQTAHPLYQIIEEQTNVTAITLSTAGTVTGQSTGAGTPGVFVAATAYQSTLWQSAAMNSTFNSFFNFGAVLSAITFVVGFTGSTLPNCTATISVSNAAGTKLTQLSSTTFTAPQTVNILTDAATTITLPTPITVPPGILRIDLSTPAAQLFNTKYCPVATQVGVSNVIATSADNYSFTFVVTPYLSSKIFSIGDQGGGIGQFVMGANGSPFTQIRTYTFSGTLPAVAKNTFATIGPLAATGAATTDMLTIATLIALPTNNIFYTNAFVNATNQITFTVANYSATNYAGGNAYTVKIMGLT